MLLSVIIVNYNTGALTKALVESLLEQLEIDTKKLRLPGKGGGPDRQVEIIVVDNDSQDDSVSFLRSDFPEIHVIANSTNGGLAVGVNKGIAAARGKYYLILNPDMIALPGALLALSDFMEKHADVGIAGAKLLSPNNDVQRSCFRFYHPMTVLYRRTRLGRSSAGKRAVSEFLMNDFDYSQERDVDWLQGSCMIVRAAAVKEIGGMDERYFMYFEDVDWCRRFWQSGWRVTFIPYPAFSHFHQRSSERGSGLAILSSRLTREHIKSAIRYFWKFRGQPLPREVQAT